MSGLEADQTDPAEVLVSYHSEFLKDLAIYSCRFGVFLGGLFFNRRSIKQYSVYCLYCYFTIKMFILVKKVNSHLGDKKASCFSTKCH